MEFDVMVKSRLDFLDLGQRQTHGILLVHVSTGKLEAERLQQKRLHVREREIGILLEEIADTLLEAADAHRLVRQAIHEQRIAGRGKTHRHAARLVVSGDEDQRIRILLLERKGDLDGLVEGEHVAQIRRGIIGMTGPVNASAFDHQEESLLVVEDLDRLGGDFGDRRLVRFRRHIDCGLKRTVGESGQDLAAARLESQEFLTGRNTLVAVLPGIFIGVAVRGVLDVIGRVPVIDVQTTAGEEVKAGVD